jgi:hypothetical protein
MHQQIQSNDIIVKKCICLESITLPKNQIEGIYDMYKKVPYVKSLKNGDLVVPISRSNADSCPTAETLKKTINSNDKKIKYYEKERVLPLVSKCVQFYGDKIIVPGLKGQFPVNADIQAFRGWSDCIAYAYHWNGLGRWLQIHIEQGFHQHANINQEVWNTLNYMCRQRNTIVHGRITRDNIQELINSAPYLTNEQTQYNFDYVDAVRCLAVALTALPENIFAMPAEYELASLLNFSIFY